MPPQKNIDRGKKKKQRHGRPELIFALKGWQSM